MKNKLLWFATNLTVTLTTTTLITPAFALDTSAGEAGIDARRLQQAPYNLLGRKIAIGQVEIGRPPQFGFDKIAASYPKVTLAGLFFRNDSAISNKNVDGHASMVASVMISQEKRFRGIAPKAKLFVSAVGVIKKSGQPEECLASQHIASQNGGDVRAINFSFGESLQRDPRKENAKLDGNALLTQCIDWSARVHDVVYVIAGNQGKGGIPIPTDNYNGITTAYSTKRKDIFTKVDFANLSSLPIGIGRSLISKEIDFGARRAVSLLAPGSKISLYNSSGKVEEVSGTSFAAPHITALIALLQEFVDRQIKQKVPNWSLDSRRHEVTKAVLLNSVDKLKDTGNGLLLGMTRTILSKQNYTWLESDAYKNAKIPLDIEMGTGHLNAFRAYQQLQGGQWQPNKNTANIGWNYSAIAAKTSQNYSLDKPLTKDSFVSITLAWDRLVELNDTNKNEQYDIGESFRDRGLNNLDIHLVSLDNNQIVCSSNSDVDSVEHIFCKVPKTGRYQIRVSHRQQVNQPQQPYGIAWWTASNSK
jgi:subtilisin family serine protease